MFYRKTAVRGDVRITHTSNIYMFAIPDDDETTNEVYKAITSTNYKIMHGIKVSLKVY